MLAQEEELGELLKELSGHERAAAFEVSIYQSIRERGPDPDPVQLAEAVEQASREIIAASDARVNLGQLRQLELWQSTLPLGRDVARLDAQVRHPPRRRHRPAGRHRAAGRRPGSRSRSPTPAARSR